MARIAFAFLFIFCVGDWVHGLVANLDPPPLPPPITVTCNYTPNSPCAYV